MMWTHFIYLIFPKKFLLLCMTLLRRELFLLRIQLVLLLWNSSLPFSVTAITRSENIEVLLFW